MIMEAVQDDPFDDPFGEEELEASMQFKPEVEINLLCSGAERPRMVSVINRLAKSKAGRETLEIAAKAGYSVAFMDMGKNCHGVCNRYNKRIGLAPWADDDKLVATLCHEARHAGQNVRMADIPDHDQLNVASIIRSSRAKEADAQAFALKVCKELERQGDNGPLTTFAKSYPQIYGAFENALAEQNGVLNDKVVAAAFKGWYDQKGVKQKYEELYLVGPMNNALDQIDHKAAPAYTFEKNVPSEKIVKEVGWTKDGNYLKDENPAFLDEERYISLGGSAKRDAQDFFSIRKEKTGIEGDKSVDSMPTYRELFIRKFPEIGKRRQEQRHGDLSGILLARRLSNSR